MDGSSFGNGRSARGKVKHGAAQGGEAVGDWGFYRVRWKNFQAFSQQMASISRGEKPP